MEGEEVFFFYWFGKKKFIWRVDFKNLFGELGWF